MNNHHWPRENPNISLGSYLNEVGKSDVERSLSACRQINKTQRHISLNPITGSERGCVYLPTGATINKSTCAACATLLCKHAWERAFQLLSKKDCSLICYELKGSFSNGTATHAQNPDFIPNFIYGHLLTDWGNVNTRILVLKLKCHSSFLF